MIRQSYLACSAGLILVLGACGDSSTGLSANISQADANKLAADMDAVSTLGTADFGLGASFSVGIEGSAAAGSVSAAPGSVSAAVTTFNNSFDVTHPCPKGGTVQLKGGINGSGDRTTHSLTVDANAVRTDAACAFEAKDGGTITVNGAPNIAYKGHLNIVNGAFVGLQTQSHEGHITLARDGGAAVPCDIKVASSFDPATHTVTVTGNVCEHIINVTHTRG
jgi:hypothetical protein